MLNRLQQILSRKSSEEAPDSESLPEGSGILVNAYCTRKAVPKLTFRHRLIAARGRPDAELDQHLDGFVGYVTSRGAAQMTQMKYHVLLHIGRVRQQFSFFVDETQMDAMSAWAVAANAIIFLPDGHVRDPNGRVLVSASGGEPEAEAAVPYPPEARQRKAATEAFLEAKGIRVLPNLPPVVAEPELDLRSPQDVAVRALALLTVAVRAEALAHKNPMSREERRERLPASIVKLTPKETAFFDHDAPAQIDVVQFAWRYECLAVLAWALGLVADLPFPEGICDVAKTVQVMLATSPATLVKRARLRDPGQILDALDLHYRLHWYVTEIRLGRKEALPGLESGVIKERHYALNWLVGFEGAEWDDVETTT